MTASFAERLSSRIQRFGPLCIGIDPSNRLLAQCELPDSAEGALAFGRRVIDAVDAELPIIKPQAAYFERFGSAGWRALEQLCAHAQSAGLMVLLDGKRGDIDATADAYGDAYFGPSSTLPADAITVHAYLGYAALAGLVARARTAAAGVFVVVRSSNPEGQALQQAVTADGSSVAMALAAQISADNASHGDGAGAVGAVVGATCTDAAATVAALPQSFILAPGVGAQGATLADVAERMPQARGRVLPSVSRAILRAGADPAALKQTICQLRDQAKALLSG